MCWDMLQCDGGILVKQQEKLDLLIKENPALARQLILLGREPNKRPRHS